MEIIKNAILLGAFALANIATALAQTVPALAVSRLITLPGVTGKFDHFAIDESGHRLFAAATGNHSVEVVDLATGTIAESLKNMGKPHVLAWIPATGRLFVADGGKAELDVYSGSPLKQIKTIPLSDDADDMTYDDVTNLLYVAHGGSNAANPPRIAVIEATTMRLIADISVASHPEAIELDPDNDRIFANIADVGQVAVIDGKTHSIMTTWALKDEKGNTPLIYDTADGLLLIGSRNPARLIALNAKTGEELATANSDAEADDLFYEPATHRAYLITGGGAFDTFAVSADGKLQPLMVTRTAAGAKTGLLDLKQGLLYVGVPGVTEAAQIRVYQTKSK